MPLTRRRKDLYEDTCCSEIAYGMLTVDFTAIAVNRKREKAFVHAVMEGTIALSQDGRGPAECGVAIVFLIVVTL